MAGWHHRLNGHESEWTLGVGDGQGGLACCDSWGHKELDTTEWLNWLTHWCKYLQLLYFLLGLIPWLLCSVLLFSCNSLFFLVCLLWVLLLQLSSDIHLHRISFPSPFSVYLSVGLRSVSCRQPVYESCFCIHSTSLCLLVGEFHLFTFKIIINMHVPITNLGRAKN